MMLPNQTIDRRTVLKGLGTAVALPLLDAMLPRLAVAGLNAPKKDLPLRLGVVKSDPFRMRKVEGMK